MCEDCVRPTRAREVPFFALAILIFLPPTLLCAGRPMSNVRCGQQVQERFDKVDQAHEHRIEAEPGQTLDIQVSPIGDYLSLWVIVSEPGGAKIADSGYQKQVQLQTGKLSAKGLYSIKVYNSQRGARVEDKNFDSDDNPGPGNWGGWETRTGDYVLSVTCINSDGTWVVQGAKNGSPGSPSGAGTSGPPAAVPGKPLGKYSKEFQEVQATIGGVATTVQALRELWGAFRPKRQPGEGVPSPVYESPQDLVPRGQQPVYAKPVEAPVAQSQRMTDGTRALPSGGRRCQDNYEESGETPSGRSFKSHVEIAGTTIEKAFLAVGRAIGLEGFLGVTTNKDLGLISAYQEDGGKKSTVNAVLSESGSDTIRVEIVFRLTRESQVSDAEARERLCRFLAAASP